MAAVSSALAYRSAPAASRRSMAPCAWFISLLGGSAHAAGASDEHHERARRSGMRTNVNTSGGSRISVRRSADAADHMAAVSVGAAERVDVLYVGRPRRDLAAVLGAAAMKGAGAAGSAAREAGACGRRSLGDNELVALLLGTGVRERSALVVAQDVLDVAGGVRGLGARSRRRAARVPGVGAPRAARLLAAVELGRRAVASDVGERPQLRRRPRSARYLLPRYGGHRGRALWRGAARREAA